MYLCSHSDLLTAPLYCRKMANARRQNPRPILCLCGAVSASLLCGDPARCFPSARTELLLIYRIQSHTNPKRRDFPLKHTGQKSVKEELPKQRKEPKRSIKCRLKVTTRIWEHDVGCSSHLTPTRKSRCGNPRRDFSMESCPCCQEGAFVLSRGKTPAADLAFPPKLLSGLCDWSGLYYSREYQNSTKSAASAADSGTTWIIKRSISP